MSAHIVLPESDGLAPLDRPRLCQLLEEASAACFPPTELIGKAPQRDFYFRRLLQKLIENTQNWGTPVVGGSQEELHAFVCNAEPDWRRASKHVRPYKLSSIKGLLSHWKSTFTENERTYTSKRGRVRFFYVPSTATAPDTLLGAEVTEFVTCTGTRLDIPVITALPDAARLPKLLSHSATASISAHKATVVDRHVQQVFGRGDFAGLYREKLSRKTLTEIGEHVRAYNQALISGNLPSAWTIITAVLLGWLWYSAAATPRFTPTYTVKNHQASISNIVGNSEGQIAEFSEDGKQLTPWVNRVENPDTGAYASLVPDGRGGYHFKSGGPYTVEFETPSSWKNADSETPLPTAVEWAEAPCNERHAIFSVWLDTRSYLPAASSKLPFTLTAQRRGSSADSSTLEETAPSQTFQDGARYRFTFHYAFPGPGEYDVILVYSPDTYQKADGTHWRTQTSARRVARLLIPTTGSPVARPAGETGRAIDGGQYEVNFCTSGGREIAQVAMAYTSDRRPFGLVVVPDRDTWPPFAELAKAAYAVKIDWHTWVQKEDIRVERTASGHYYFLVPLLPADKQYFAAELHGSYEGIALPSSKPVGILINSNAATLTPRDYRAYVTPCNTVTWSSEYDLAGTGTHPSAAPPVQTSTPGPAAATR